MNLRFLLDTSVVSAPTLAAPDPKLLRRLEQRSAQCAVAAPVWHELNYGVARLPAGRRRAALDFYVHTIVKDRFPVLPYDLAAAEWQARERARLEAAGRAPPFIDGQIAAIASTRNLVLVTLNARDFAAYEDLEVVDWSR